MQRCVRWHKSFARLHSSAHLRIRHGPFVQKRHATSSASNHASRQRTTIQTLNERQHRQSGPNFVPDAFLPPADERRDPSAWITLVETLLKQRRQTPSLKDVLTPPVSPRILGNIVALARRTYNLDVIALLAERGQWKTAIDLVDYLIENLWKGRPDQALNIPSSAFARVKDLNLVSRDPFEFDPQDSPSSLHARKSFKTLDDALADEHPLNHNTGITIGHQVLGQIWQSLGNIILADAQKNETITLEILEILAALHHRGIMPDSIYQYQPVQDGSALRQPPTLHLLSSNILTSLSDAAWRAHEKTVVEEATIKGELRTSLRPEIPGSVYRVRIAGLKHEIWLELVLWACIHGGWSLHGAAILESLSKTNQWRVLSWREMVLPKHTVGEGKAIDWNRLRSLFGFTQPDTEPSQYDPKPLDVVKSVSAEIVTAHVASLINSIGVGVGARGNQPGVVCRLILVLKSLLEKNNLALEGLTWDAVVLRMLESQGLDIQAEPGLAERVLDLGPTYGRETNARNAPSHTDQGQPLSSYLVDGSAITSGIAHRVLIAYVQATNIGGAFRTFQTLQTRTDKNKLRAIEDFAKVLNKPVKAGKSGEIDFTSRYAGIEYPTFFPHIPESVLAPFLELVTNAQAFEFAEWLIRSRDPDGPMIPPSTYTSPVMLPSLMHFARTTKDSKLVSQIQIVLLSLPEEDRKAVFESAQLTILEEQIGDNDWTGTRNSIRHIAARARSDPGVMAQAVAMLVRSLFRTADEAVETSIKEVLALVANSRVQYVAEQRLMVENVLVIMASVDRKWMSLYKSWGPAFRSMRFGLQKKAFNIILEGVVDGYGSAAGLRLLNLIWDESTISRESLSDENEGLDKDDEGGIPRMPAERPSSFSEDSPNALFDLTEGDTNDEELDVIVRVRGSFTPDFDTIRIILRRYRQETGMIEGNADAELDVAAKESPSTEILVWAERAFRYLGMKEADIAAEIPGKFQWGKVMGRESLANENAV